VTASRTAHSAASRTVAWASRKASSKPSSASPPSRPSACPGSGRANGALAATQRLRTHCGHGQFDGRQKQREDKEQAATPPAGTSRVKDFQGLGRVVHTQDEKAVPGLGWGGAVAVIDVDARIGELLTNPGQ